MSIAFTLRDAKGHLLNAGHIEPSLCKKYGSPLELPDHVVGCHEATAGPLHSNNGIRDPTRM